MSRYPRFDQQGVVLGAVAQRGHDLLAADCRSSLGRRELFSHRDLPRLAEYIHTARRAERSSKTGSLRPNQIASRIHFCRFWILETHVCCLLGGRGA